jgi:hypothetical protein
MHNAINMTLPHLHQVFVYGIGRPVLSNSCTIWDNACVDTIYFTYFIRITVILIDYSLFHLITILYPLPELSNFYVSFSNTSTITRNLTVCKSSLQNDLFLIVITCPQIFIAHYLQHLLASSTVHHTSLAPAHIQYVGNASFIPLLR